MLQEAQNRPAIFFQMAAYESVTLDILAYFFIPESPSCGRSYKTYRTVMPETTVNKYSYVLPGKNDIRMPW